MKTWIQASRPLAHINIAVPLILGQAAAWHVTGRFSWWWLAAALLWGALDHWFVVFANDFADQEADSGQRTLLSGGSGVIPEGKLTARQVERAAQSAALLLLLYSSGLVFLGRGLTPLYALAALLLMWLYSFKPVRLSYRGGGELLQGIGVGIGLPSLGYYLQTEIAFAPGWVIGPATLLGVCSNVLTALPDVEDDAKAEKRTWPVRQGMRSARRFASAGIAFAALAIFLWTPSVPIPAKAALSVAPLLPLLAGARAVEPFRAAWWSSIALNLLVGFWVLAMLLAA
ncbi:MAG: prenyltransferase [Myxococcales bacterium]|nr:prenyltransferase [Deltaproteobacteria bacterium]NNE16977.1 prenyltransferase [Myxococcales bacterium]